MDFGDDEDLRTIYCGNISSKVNEELLYELFLQAGPVEKVRIPNDREGRPFSYGFVTFKHQCSVQYALTLLDGVSLFNTRLNLRPRNPDIYANNTPVFNLTPTPSHSPTPALYNHNQNRTPSGRQDYYRNESLKGRWCNQNKRDRDMKPNNDRKNNYKRHKR